MKKILAIDDDEAILEVVKFILESSDYDVRTSENGQIDGIIESFKPDMILLDVLLSGEDGRDIARRLKADEKTKKIPLIMISAHPSAEKGAINAGADEFIAKPFEIDHFLNVISRRLATRL